MFRTLFAIALMLASSFAIAADPGPIATAVKYAAPELSRFINQKIDDNREAGNITALEAETLKDEPGLLLVLPRIKCRAVVISQYVCGVKPSELNLEVYNDEETDSLRHFIFSALLARYFGREVALRYSNAHEDFNGKDPSSLDDREKMDISNNRVGIDWMTSGARRLTNITNVDLARAALRALQKGELSSLTKTGKRCLDPKFKLNGFSHGKKIREYRDELVKHRPHICMSIKETYDSH